MPMRTAPPVSDRQSSASGSQLNDESHVPWLVLRPSQLYRTDEHSRLAITELGPGWIQLLKFQMGTGAQLTPCAFLNRTTQHWLGSQSRGSVTFIVSPGASGGGAGGADGGGADGASVEARTRFLRRQMHISSVVHDPVLVSFTLKSRDRQLL